MRRNRVPYRDRIYALYFGSFRRGLVEIRFVLKLKNFVRNIRLAYIARRARLYVGGVASFISLLFFSAWKNLVYRRRLHR